MRKSIIATVTALTLLAATYTARAEECTYTETLRSGQQVEASVPEKYKECPRKWNKAYKKLSCSEKVAVRMAVPRQEFQKDLDRDGDLESLVIEGNPLPCAWDWGAKQISVTYGTDEGKRMVHWKGYTPSNLVTVDNGIVFHGETPLGKRWALKVDTQEWNVNPIYGPAFTDTDYRHNNLGTEGSVNTQLDKPNQE